jgi:2-polyprenyl-3-methyl-5-hydroxy-6-metoxy-1,4-benzoquinol methylase
MNRKQRRAAAKQAPPAGTAADAGGLFAEALRLQQQHRFEDAARAYKRLLLVKPDHAEACNNLGCVLQAEGKLREASASFARALALVPQLFNEFAAICKTLTALLPPLAEAMRRANDAWPVRPPIEALLAGSSLAVIAGDPLLLTILRLTPVRDIALERALTVMRFALLEQAAAGAPVDDTTLAFTCILAQQCFINEYVFATTPKEDARIDALTGKLRDLTPMQLAAIAMYVPLHTLADAQSLLERAWPRAVDEVVTQALREPLQERALRSSIPRFTAIDDAVSLRVQQQYEENPYPRWVQVAGNVEPVTVDEYLRSAVPGAVFTSLGAGKTIEVLVAGCGTGALPIEFARKIVCAQVLGIDLSLTSLSYAKRKTPAELAGRLDYAQADILKLGALERSFDVIDASGVLHHMAEPATGLRCLLPLLRPGGVMHLGLYSALARREVTAARKYFTEKNYGSTAQDIRRARQDLLNSDLRGLAQVSDFFSTSECRDLLFHVQEHQMTIAQIKSLLAENGLRFVGFAFDPMRARHYAAAFAQAGRPISSLDAWQEFEALYPDTFLGMYQFWVQKPRA